MFSISVLVISCVRLLALLQDVFCHGKSCVAA